MHARTVALVLLAHAACGPSPGDGSGGRDGGGSDGDDDSAPDSDASNSATDSAGDDGADTTTVGEDDTADASSHVGGDPEQPTGLRDESGALFAWVCGADADRPDHCSIERIPDVSPPFPDCGAREAAYRYEWGDYFLIAGACDSATDGTWTGVPDGGRCAVCEMDAECPQIVDREDYFECREGYCQNVDPEKYESPLNGCGNTAPRYGCEDPGCSSGIPE